MSENTRRTFIKSCAAAGAGLQMPGLLSTSAYAADKPAMSIARYKNPSDDAASIDEEAKKLTKSAIDALGGMSRFISKGDVVWVKPNIGWDRRPDQAANTHPVVVATLVEMCYEAGAKVVNVSDKSCHDQQKTFPRSGIQEAAKKAGAKCFFLDDRKWEKMNLKGKAIQDWEVYKDIVAADKIINVPIVKHHILSTCTLGMKNLMGVISGARNRYHQDINNSIVDLAAFIKPDLIVIDGIRTLIKNGPVGGNLKDVVRKDTVAAGTDQVALDAFASTLLGHKPESIGHILEASKRGLGTIDYASLSPREIQV